VDKLAKEVKKGWWDKNRSKCITQYQLNTRYPGASEKKSPTEENKITGFFLQ